MNNKWHVDFCVGAEEVVGPNQKGPFHAHKHQVDVKHL